MSYSRRLQELLKDRLEEEDDAEELEEFMSDGDGEPLDSLEAPIEMNRTFPNTILITNLPKVGKEKLAKLTTVAGKLIDKSGPNEKTMPFNEETGQTEGLMIVTFENTADATKACETLDGMSLDRAHTFKVVKLDQFNEVMSRTEEFVPKRTLEHFDRSDFRDWLADKKCREQILLRYQDETEIYWHDMMTGVPQLCYGGEREKRQKKLWCDWKVQWSPRGSYLATFHKPGIALWAGPEFHKKVRFAHDSVKNIMFSPDEEFILTWNGAHSSERDDGAVRIFRVLTGELMRACKTPTVTPLGGEFPHFLWSHDGQYFAECNETTIFVRDTENFDLIRDERGKRGSLKYDGLHTFQWSPKANLISAWIPEKGNNPARLVLVEIPSRKELTSRSRTQCEAQMHWQSEGEYLCLQVTKLSRTKKKEGTNLEIFRIRERDIPVEIVQVKDTVRGFFWETKGCRFAALTTDESGHHPKLVFYSLAGGNCEQVCVFDLPSNSFNQFYWAPEGQYFVAAAVSGGDLLFGGLTPENKLEILHKDEHFMITQVEWDPSSRYVITAVTQPMRDEMGGFKYQMEAGYAIWTFQGRVIHRLQKEKLWQISWRPHPKSLLTPDREKYIRKNIKQFSKRYDALDEQAKESARASYQKARDVKTNGFREVLDRLSDYYNEKMEETGWDEAWNKHLADQGWEPHEEIKDEELESMEELISG